MDELTIYKFQPDAMDKETLEKIFVGSKQKQLLERLCEEIREAAKARKPRYYLIVGPRGIGKTHLITLLYYRLSGVGEAFPVKLSEEEFSVFRVSDLLQRVLEIIGHNRTFSLKFEGMSEDDILVALLEELKKLDKSLVLFIENLDQIIGKQMSESEVKRLRSLLQMEKMFIIVATAPLIFPEISSHGEPFFNFFEIVYITELTRDELKELLKRLAELDKNADFLKEIGKLEHRIDAIATLTGGNPRIAILLYDLTKAGKLLDVEKAFFRILDDYTPYYQDLFKMLSGEQRRIFDELISVGKPATPKELALRTRLPQSVVNSQLRRLERDGFVISHKVGKKTLYEVKDKLFRLWRELRKEPFGRERISILITFLEVWYSVQERLEMLSKCIVDLEKLRDECMLREMSYWLLSLPAKYRRKVLTVLVKRSLELGKEQVLEEVIAYDEKLRKEIAVTRIFLMIENGKYKEALEAIDKESSWRNTTVPWMLKTFVFLSWDKLAEALKAANKVLELDERNVPAWIAKGFALAYLGRLEEGLHAFERAVELDPTNETAWGMKGEILWSLGRSKEALQASSKVIEMNPKLAIAWDLRSRIFESLGKMKESLEAIEKAIELDPQDSDAWRRKGEILMNIEKYEEALEAFSNALNLDPNDIEAWIGKGFALKIIGRESEAQEVFLKVLSFTDQIIKTKPHDVVAWIERAEALAGLEKYKDAASAFLKAADLTSSIEGKQDFINLAVDFILQDSRSELARRNIGNFIESLRLALTLIQKSEQTKQQRKIATRQLTQFLICVVGLGDIETLRLAINEISNALEFSKEFLKPFQAALEIVETGDINKYYAVQLELRDMVAKMVRALTGSDKLAPPKEQK